MQFILPYMMVEFLLFCIATVGMTSIITQGVIFQPFRKRISDRANELRHLREIGQTLIPNPTWHERFNELINCAQCTGFWCGLFCGIFLITSDGFLFTGFDIRQILNRTLMWFCCGLGGSFLSTVGCNIIDLIFYRKMNALRQLEEQDILLAERYKQKQENENITALH